MTIDPNCYWYLSHKETNRPFLLAGRTMSFGSKSEAIDFRNGERLIEYYVYRAITEKFCDEP